MRRLVAILVALFAILFLTAMPLVAQELPPPPPPPDIEGTDVEDSEPADGVDTSDSGEPADARRDGENPVREGEVDAGPEVAGEGDSQLAILEPPAGGSIGRATVIEGTAKPRASIEIWIDDELEQRMKADANGRFKATISGLEPGTRVRIEARQLDAAGGIVASTSVVSRVTMTEPNEVIEEPPVIADEPGGVREPAPPPELEPDPIERSPPVAQKTIEAPVGQVARGAISTTAGVLGGYTGATVGFLGGILVGITLEPDSFAALGYAVIGAAAGYLVAMPTAVYLTGYMLDGDGNIILTVLANVGGLVMSALLGAFIADNVNTSSGYFSLGLSLGITTVGAASGALAFELTSNPSRRAARQESLSIRPTVAPSSDGSGVVMGIGGRW